MQVAAVPLHGVLLTLLLSLGTPAGFSQENMKQAMDMCLGTEAEKVFDGCDWMLNSGQQMSEITLARAFNRRGLAYNIRGDYELAVADFSSVLDIAPGATTKPKFYKTGLIKKGTPTLSDPKISTGT